MSLRLADVRIAVGHRILLDVSFEARAGDVTAIVAPNGAGKTTLLRAIAGLHPLASGAITLDGAALHALAPRARALRVALVGGDDGLLDGISVREAVAAARYAHRPWYAWTASADDERAVDEALAAVDLGSLAASAMPTLSSGERQRAWIALALAQRAPLLLLDEPTSHLDLRAAVDVLGVLRASARAGRIVVVVLHALEEAAEFADRVALLGAGGLLAAGTPAEVLTEAFLARAYGVPIGVEQTQRGPVFRRAVSLRR